MRESAFRFGRNDSLFGVFHEADSERPARAVVFCPPLAEEKKSSYRAFVETARRLAAAGVPCLRFDYFGTGDSDGNFRQFAPSRAIDDAVAAARTARQRAGTDAIALLGLRLGGALALAAAPRAGAERVLLWEPIVSGGGFFDLTIKRQMLRRQLIGGSAAESDEAIVDLDGYPLSREAAEEIRSLDAAAALAAFDGPADLLQIRHSESVSRESQQMIDAGGDRLRFAAVVCEPFWSRIDRADTSPVIEWTVRVLGGGS